MSRQMKIMNEDRYQTYIPVPAPIYKSNSPKIKSVRLKMISHDKKYKERANRNETFIITNPNPLHSDGKRTINGIFSPYFGQDLMNPDSNMYSCECKTLIGGVNEGRMCPICETKVQYIDPDLRMMAYVDIAPYHLLSHHGYNRFKKVLKNLPDILTRVKKIDKSGKQIADDVPTIIDLYEDYEDKYEDLVGLPKEVVFLSKIPVYSAILRPLIQRDSTIDMFEVNKRYLSIVTLAEDLKNISHLKAPTQIVKNLNKLQEELCGGPLDMVGIFEHINSQIKGKGGVFRKYGVSGRIDYSSRVVIRLGVDLEAHEIDLPYQTVITLYEEEITNMISTMHNVDLARAAAIYQNSLNVRDPFIVKIIEGLIKRNGGLWCLINRNPSISRQSLCYMKIRKINDSFTDYCMAVPVDIISGLGADFDGDQMTVAAVKNMRYHEILWKTFCPTNFYIDRSTGYFNRTMGLLKDYAAIISASWDMFRKIDDYIKFPEELTKKRLDDLNIDPLNEHRSIEEYEKLMAYSSKIFMDTDGIS